MKVRFLENVCFANHNDYTVYKGTVLQAEPYEKDNNYIAIQLKDGFTAIAPGAAVGVEFEIVKRGQSI